MGKQTPLCHPQTTVSKSLSVSTPVFFESSLTDSKRRFKLRAISASSLVNTIFSMSSSRRPAVLENPMGWRDRCKCRRSKVRCTFPPLLGHVIAALILAYSPWANKMSRAISLFKTSNLSAQQGGTQRFLCLTAHLIPHFLSGSYILRIAISSLRSTRVRSEEHVPPQRFLLNLTGLSQRCWTNLTEIRLGDWQGVHVREVKQRWPEL